MAVSRPVAASVSVLRQAQTLLERGFARSARELVLPLLEAAPRHFETLRLMAAIDQRMDNSSDAAERWEQCARLRPNDLSTLAAFVQALYRAGRLDQAASVCQRAMAAYPLEPCFPVQMALLQDQRTDHAGAWQTLQPLLAGAEVSAEAAGVAGRVLARLGRHAEAMQWLRRSADHPRSSGQTRRTSLLYLAQVHDSLKQYDDAMAMCVEAHAAIRSTFDRADYVASIDAIMSTFDTPSLRGLARAQNDSRLPVFVIGMPRSGTTLVEQIIAAHPQVFGAGEIYDIVNLAKSVTTQAGSMHAYPDSLADLTPQIAGQTAETYLKRLRELGGDAQRVSNKMLEQYEHVGFIWMLLPQARIIHVRRNPMDTCLSCYTRHLNPERMPYVCNLEHLGLAYHEHERLMNHWKATLDLPILTVQYEDLVADQPHLTRQIIDFLDLPWDERCLRYWESKRLVTTLSFDQVNKPIYDSSIGRWKNYEKHLGPLKQALGLA